MIGKNNPLNIRYNKRNSWIGLSANPSRKGFCRFDRLVYCYRAAYIIIFRSYYNRGLRTYSAIINAYAPPTENDTCSYVDYVCNRLKVFPFDIPSSVNDRLSLLSAMSYYECGFSIKPHEIASILLAYDSGFFNDFKM